MGWETHSPLLLSSRLGSGRRARRTSAKTLTILISLLAPVFADGAAADDWSGALDDGCKHALSKQAASHRLEMLRVRSEYEGRIVALEKELAAALAEPAVPRAPAGAYPRRSAQRRQAGESLCGFACADAIPLAKSMFGLTCDNTYDELVKGTGVLSLVRGFRSFPLG